MLGTWVRVFNSWKGSFRVLPRFKGSQLNVFLVSAAGFMAYGCWLMEIHDVNPT